MGGFAQTASESSGTGQMSNVPTMSPTATTHTADRRSFTLHHHTCTQARETPQNAPSMNTHKITEQPIRKTKIASSRRKRVQAPRLQHDSSAIKRTLPSKIDEFHSCHFTKSEILIFILSTWLSSTNCETTKRWKNTGREQGDSTTQCLSKATRKGAMGVLFNTRKTKTDEISRCVFAPSAHGTLAKSANFYSPSV